MSTDERLREALESLTKELHHYAEKHGLGPARLMKALHDADAALAATPAPQAAPATFDARAWEGLIEAVARDAVMLAFVRAELSCVDGPFSSSVEVAVDAAKAIMGEETCADEPIKSATQLLAQIRAYAAGQAASGAQQVTIQRGELIPATINGEPGKVAFFSDEAAAAYGFKLAAPG